MAVFRIEKTQNYTVMSNHHLRNKALSLKAKGLLSQMLSLPENWDFTLVGLSFINKESVEAIRTAVLELEHAGYITRRQLRDGKGKMANIEYTIYELPQEPDTPELVSKPFSPSCDYPITDKPLSGFPLSDCPTSENATQLNKDKAITERSNTDISSTDSIPFTSYPREPERKGTEAESMNAFEIYREIIRDNLEYDLVIERYPHDRERIGEIVDLMLETVCTARKTIRVAGDDYPAELVKAKFLKLDSSHLEFVLDCMRKNTTEIRNIKKYLLAVLFNAPSTIDSYNTSLVAHDMANGHI
jgi:hypothetical protein